MRLLFSKQIVAGVILTCIILLTVTVLVDKLLLFLIYPIVKRGIVEVVMDDSGVTAFLYPAMVHWIHDVDSSHDASSLYSTLSWSFNHWLHLEEFNLGVNGMFSVIADLWFAIMMRRRVQAWNTCLHTCGCLSSQWLLLYACGRSTRSSFLPWRWSKCRTSNWLLVEARSYSSSLLKDTASIQEIVL